MGFSYVGLIYLLLLFIPNLVWARHMPPGYSVREEKRILKGFEKVGQVLITSCALIFSDFNLRPFSPWSLWLVLSFLSMVIYEACWLRYFKRPTLPAMYAPLGLIPVPLASLPVLAFLLLGIYGKVIWLVLAALILGIGHIGIHIQHFQTLKRQ
nr:hypothetical protein [Gehongia tenuis]